MRHTTQGPYGRTYHTNGMKHGARTRVHRKQGVYSSWYKTSSACVRTTDVTVVFPLGVWGAMGCSGGGMRIVWFRFVCSMPAILPK
jgi:hypothetical protein